MSTPSFPNQPPPVTPKKGKGPLFWILIGVGMLMFLGLLIVGGAAFFFSKVMDNAGVSFNDLKSNPARTAARLLVSADRDLEVIGDGDSEDSLTVRRKSTGEVMTVRMNPQTKQIEFRQAGKDGSVTIDGESGQLKVQTEDGTTATYGVDTGASLPSWIPAYPGTSPKSNLSAKTAEGTSGTFTFTTQDSPQKVFDFYEERLKSAGFKIESRLTQPAGGMMIAQDTGEKHQVVFTVGAGGEVMIQASEKN